MVYKYISYAMMHLVYLIYYMSKVYSKYMVVFKLQIHKSVLVG